MRARAKRFWLIVIAGVILCSCAGLTLFALRNQVSLFYTPADLIAQGGGQTIAEVNAALEAERNAKAMEDPLVKAIFDAFPKAKITAFNAPVETVQDVVEAALPEVEDEWDPFED